MDHSTAVMVLINAMQSDKSLEDIEKEIQGLLEAVVDDLIRVCIGRHCVVVECSELHCRNPRRQDTERADFRG